MPLPDAFQTKHPLRFRKDGGYRILMMSDAHHKPAQGARTVRAMETLIDATKPDLVLLRAAAGGTGISHGEAPYPLGPCVRQP